MESITSLLKEIAESLGTTVDQLWSIMLKQAPISAATDILQYGILVGVIYWWAKVSTKFEFGELRYFLPWVVIVILLVIAFFSFPSTVTKLTNPEYWATMKILDELNLK